MFLKNEFSNRLVQVSLFAGIVYYITAYPVVFESARKYFPIKFKKTHHLLIFHTFVFMVLMYILTYFVFDPIVRVVEGNTNGSANNAEGAESEKDAKPCNDGECEPGMNCVKGICVNSQGVQASVEQPSSKTASSGTPVNNPQ